MIPTASPALLYKLRTVQQQHLRAPQSSPAPLPSPCISVCRMDAQRMYCEGCLRTLDELRIWSTADEATKRTIWQRISERTNPIST